MKKFIDYCHQRSYKAKETIISEGDKPDSLYYVVSGTLTVQTTDEDGREMVLAYLGPGNFVGEMGLFGDESSRSAWVMAKTDAVLGEMDYSKFHDLAVLNPNIVMAIAGQLARRLRATSRRARSLAFLDVTGRVAETLRELSTQEVAQPVEEGVLISVNQTELAKLIGCSREMVSRVMRELSDDGMLRVEGRKILLFTHSL